MRVLWLDANQNPWTDTSGFTLLEEFGIAVDRVHDVFEAKEKIEADAFDLFVLTTEVSGALELLADTKKKIRKAGKKIILCSPTWTKEDFKQHAKTSAAAQRYARLPMPVEGFLSVAAELCECTVDELRAFNPDTPPPLRMAKEPKAAITENASDDVETLRKYLRMREEQLELLSSEREELHQDNGQLRHDLQKLEQRLRDSDTTQGELAKKTQYAESELGTLKETQAIEKERFEQELRINQEKLKIAEVKFRESEERCEDLRLRVRKDIRKIRANERDLEARLEILRKDSETLLAAREQKVLELQRKIDALEFDLDQVQDNRVQAEMESERYLAKLSRVTRALHIAIGVIEEDHVADEALDELEPVLGGAAEDSLPMPEMPSPDEATIAVEQGTVDTVDHYAALAADGDPTQMIQSNEFVDPSDNDGNQAAG